MAWTYLFQWVEREGRCLQCDARIDVRHEHYRNSGGVERSARIRSACDCQREIPIGIFIAKWDAQLEVEARNRA